MSDRPTLYRQAWELNEHAPNAVYTVDHVGHYYEGYLVPVRQCEHGNVFTHPIDYDVFNGELMWCDGSPTLEKFSE